MSELRRWSRSTIIPGLLMLGAAVMPGGTPWQDGSTFVALTVAGFLMGWSVRDERGRRKKEMGADSTQVERGG
jgi:hypothetical protein